MVSGTKASQARRNLDRRLAELAPATRFAAPRSGWVRAVRDALGMSAAVLGRRLGVSAQAVNALETSEREGGARLETLRRAADALDCVFVYAFLPRVSLEATVQAQAHQVAAALAQATAHSMALEDQQAALDDTVIQSYAHRLIAAGQQWQELP